LVLFEVRLLGFTLFLFFFTWNS